MSSRQVDEAAALGGRVIDASDHVSEGRLRRVACPHRLRVAPFIKGHLVMLKADGRFVDAAGRVNDEAGPYIELPDVRINDFNWRWKPRAFDGDLDRIALGEDQNWDGYRQDNRQDGGKQFHITSDKAISVRIDS